MKIIRPFLLLSLFLPIYLTAQTVEDDFEGNGTINSWFGDDCDIETDFSNPFNNASNNSQKVLRYNDLGGSYANVRFDVSANFDLSNNNTFSLKIYVPSSGISGSQANQVSLKLQDGTLAEPWGTQTEIIKSISLDQWQTLSFDFQNDNFINLDANSPDPITRTDFNRVLIQVNGENNNDVVEAFIDDVTYDGVIPTPPSSSGSNYTMLVWSDEFDGNGAIDDSKWFHQTQLPNGTSWYNNEVQHYTDRIENSFVENGFLSIMAKKETFTDQGQTKDYTSARLNSKFAFTYGKVEARAKLPFGLGTWPAIWTLGKNIAEPGGYWNNQFGTVGWPACGEIDIMEHWGNNQNYVQSALHTPSSFGGTINHGGVMANDVSNTFHTYTLVWTPEKMDFSLDGQVYYTYNPDPKNMDTWPFIAEQYLLLNVAMQGAIDPGFTESPMVIDYIRIYQEDTTTLSLEKPKMEQFNAFPNPASDRVFVEVPASFIGANLLIQSTYGQVLNVLNINQTTVQVNLESLPKGAYFISVDADRALKPFKLIKL